ncbi:MAG: WecB/TagA/CpsF family glycosyltransferase, partial [Patescibacteria group bacterium]
RNGVAERTAVVLKNKFPDIIISGCSENEKAASQDPILLSSDILFVALGAKQQEKWICDFSFKSSSVRMAVAVGGSFDMISGDISRAPVFLRKMWLEWLWRFLMEPKKRWKRVFNAVIAFPIKVIKSRITN